MFQTRYASNLSTVFSCSYLRMSTGNSSSKDIPYLRPREDKNSHPCPHEHSWERFFSYPYPRTGNLSSWGTRPIIECNNWRAKINLWCRMNINWTSKISYYKRHLLWGLVFYLYQAMCWAFVRILTCQGPNLAYEQVRCVGTREMEIGDGSHPRSREPYMDSFLAVSIVIPQC